MNSTVIYLAKYIVIIKVGDRHFFGKLNAEYIQN